MVGGKTFCVITGASRGIGRALALAVARRVEAESQLVLLARDAQKLTEVREEIGEWAPRIRVRVAPIDLTRPDGAELEKLFESDESFEHCLLVQNAASLGDVSKRAKDLNSLDEIRDYFDLNFASFVLVNNAFLASTARMTSAKRTVVNVSSGAAYKSTKCFHLYGAGRETVLFSATCIF